MKKTLFRLLYLVMFVCIITISQSCSSSDDFFDENFEESTIGKELNSFDPYQLDKMADILAENGIIVESIVFEPQTKGIVVNDLCVSALKVSCKYPNPSGAPGYVDMSGVLLVPKKTVFTGLTNHRLIVTNPGTYTSNERAPSNLFRRVSLISEDANFNSYYFWTLQARSGYVVLIPDYLGFGDSHGQCFHPYLESKTMSKSVIALTKAAQNLLTAKGYRYKKEVIIAGYSQGGFVAASVARELETSSGYDIPVSLLITGGTPCYLNQIADGVRASDEVAQSFLLPYAFWGYKMNSYPYINPNDVLKEPYASASFEYFDGTDKNIYDKFPKKVREVYTDKFIDYLDLDPSISYIREILDENSVKPWKNKCHFVMTHGVSDNIVYYRNAADFASDQKKAGGKVTFYPTVGEHIIGIAPYYTKVLAYIGLYR